MTDEEHLRLMIDKVLVRKTTTQIDFYAGAIHVDASGFGAVRAALFANAIHVAIGGVPTGAGAAYSYGDDTFHFKHGTFGTNSLDQMNIVHESIHAMNDIRGAWASSPSGGEWTTYTQDEVSAYIAGALFMRYDFGGPTQQWLNSNPPEYAAADTIAGSIMNTKGAIVPEKDVMNLRSLIASRLVYQQLGIRLWSPSGANGLH